MANIITKAEKLTSTSVGLLLRELTAPMLVTRNLGGSFIGAKDDTIKVKIPAFLTAKERALRATTALDIDDVADSTVDVKLDTHAYKKIGVTLAELTLDINNYAMQITQPAVRSVAEKIEDKLVAVIEGATYLGVDGLAGGVTFDLAKPQNAVIEARSILNKRRVPMGDRFLFVGADVESVILQSDNFIKADQAGSDTALREAIIGRIGGFTAVSVPALAPDTAYAGHRSAYALGIQSPVVPRGAAGGASANYQGMAMTSIFGYDGSTEKDTYGVHTFIGANTVEDAGTINAVTGVFTPAETPATDDSDEIMVRAVKLSLP